MLRYAKALAAGAMACFALGAQGADKPNILVVWGDDVGQSAGQKQSVDLCVRLSKSAHRRNVFQIGVEVGSACGQNSQEVELACVASFLHQLQSLFRFRQDRPFVLLNGGFGDVVFSHHTR